MAVTAQHLYEQTLIVRSQLGDPAAFRELMTMHSPRLNAFVRKLMVPQCGRESAEDTVQEIWLAIHKGLPSLLDVRKFSPWLFRIARDRIFREFRRRKVPLEPLDQVPEYALLGVDAVESEGRIEPEELKRCLEALSVGHREVLILRFFEEMDYEEIARVTSTTLGTVRSRLHYAKRALRQVIEESAHAEKTYE
jgi:RNA polymerase sigma-70 factor, ECF subfamily